MNRTVQELAGRRPFLPHRVRRGFDRSVDGGMVAVVEEVGKCETGLARCLRQSHDGSTKTDAAGTASESASCLRRRSASAVEIGSYASSRSWT